MDNTRSPLASVPSRLSAVARAFVAPTTSDSASFARLPTRFPCQDHVSSDSGASFHPPPPSSMVFAGGDNHCSDAQVATSAQTLLALGGPGVDLLHSEQDAAVAVRKKRRVVTARCHHHPGFGRQQSYEQASAGEADGLESGSDSGVEDGATTTSSVKSDEVEDKPRKRPLRIRKHRKATHTVRKVRSS